MNSKKIICSKCNKEKIHFGKGMCSACLRNTKRQNKPSFYLGTCYSEISRRVKSFDKLRPKYFGKKICTKEEFFKRFLEDEIFLKLFKEWQESNFKRGKSPSIDRINNDADYLIDNIRFITQSENTGRVNRGKNITYKCKKVIDNFGKIYKSIKECGRLNNTSDSNIRKYISLKKPLNGKLYYFYENT